MLIRSLLVAVLLAGGAAQAAQPLDKYKITPEEHAACDDDAASLCASAYPDEDKLIDCMRANVRRLSATCSGAFVAGLKRRHLPLPE